MQKNLFVIVAYCDYALTFSIYALLFLAPIFFVPWAYDASDFNKQALLMVLSFVALVAWIAKVLISRKLSIKLSIIHVAVVVFLGVGAFYSQTFVLLATLSILYFLISNNFSLQKVYTSFSILGISFAMTLLYGALQLLGIYIVPFSAIGLSGSLGFFAVSLLPLFMVLSMVVKTWWRILFLINVFLIFTILLLINHRDLWILCLLGSLLLIIFWLARASIFNPRWACLPIFFLGVSLFFIIFSSSKVISNFADFEIIGLITFIILMVLSIFYGVAYVMQQKVKKETQKLPIVLGVLLTLVLQTAITFLYPSNISLNFICFFTLGVLVALVCENTKIYSLKSFSLITCVILATFLIVFIFSSGVLFFGGQRYVAEIYYRKGLTLFSEGKKNESLYYIKKATEITSSDLYFNQLSLFSLLRLKDELASPSIKDQDQYKQLLRSLITDVVNASNASVALEPQSFQNWSTRGYLCQNLIGLLPEAQSCAIQSYNQALLLKPDYALAYFQLGLIYDSQGQKENAILQFSKLLKLDVNKERIQKIINNIEAGKPALDQPIVEIKK